MPIKAIQRGWQGKQTSSFAINRKQRKPERPIINYNNLSIFNDFSNGVCFPNTNTTVIDLSSDGNNGTLTNGPTYASTNDGIVTFDGVNDYVDFGANSTLKGIQFPLTILVWARPTSLTGLRTLFATYDDFKDHKLLTLLRLDSGVLKYYASNSTGEYQGVGTFAVTNNQWGFFAATVSDTSTAPTCRIFYNRRVESFTLANLSTTPSTTTPTRIAANALPSNTEYFQGDIGAALIYKRESTISEVIAFYNQTRARFGA